MSDVASIQKIHQACLRVREQFARVVVGQTRILDELFIALISRGHCLLEGTPGLGKTLMVRTLAAALSLDFQRVQCTPDLMPSDITGSEMFLMGSNAAGSSAAVSGPKSGSANASGMNFVPGPIFTNLLLADEINRTPPRTQSALLEAMQENQVTIGRVSHALPQPFFVLATQNPIEQEGTYPLPEAQLDRFMFKCLVEYPSREDEVALILRTTGNENAEIQPVLNQAELMEIFPLVRRVPIAERLAQYACDICRATRPVTEKQDSAASSGNPSGQAAANSDLTDWIREYVAWGAGPRAGQALILGSKARAVLNGRLCVELEDIQALAPAVLRHRLKTRFIADAEGITADDVIQKVLRETPF